MTRKKIAINVLRFLLGAMVLAGIFYIQRDFIGGGRLSEIAGEGGYIGVLAFSLVNCFNFFVPLITASLTPLWVAGGLHPVLVVACMIAMIMVVDVGFYLLGRYSRKFTERHKSHKVIARIRSLRDRNYYLPLGFMLVWMIIAPFSNEPVTIAIGILGYRVLPVLSVMLVGNVPHNGIIAYIALISTG